MTRAGMLIQRGFIHRCTITPADNTARTDDNIPIEGWGTPVTGVPCRLTDLEDAELINARNADTVNYTDALLIGRATAIADDSRVTAIEARDPATGDWAVVDNGPFDVADVRSRYSNTLEYRRILIKRAG